MTDLPLDPDDELVTAVLDGAATPAERARVEGDPALSSRLAELRSVRDAVARPVPPLDEVTTRRLLDRAIAAADPDLAATSATASAVSATSAARRRPTHRSSTGLRLAGIAAAVAVALLAVPLVGSLGSDDGDDDQVAFEEVGDQLSDAGGSAESAPSPESLDTAEGEAMLSTEARAPVDLGPLPDIEAVTATAARAADDAPPTADTTGAAGTDGGEDDLYSQVCDVAPAGDALILDAVASVDGDVVVVRVWADGGDGRVVQVIDPVTCAVLDEARH